MALKEEVQQDRKQPVLENWFRFHIRGTTLSNEIIASIGTILISLYFMFSTAKLISNSITDGAQVLPTLLTLVLLVSGIFSILAGIITKLPLVYIGSLGINQFISVHVINGLSLNWGYGFSLLILENIIWIILSFTKFPIWCVEQLPIKFKQYSLVILGGILIFFSLMNGKVVQFNASQEVMSYTLRSPETLLFAVVFIITFILQQVKVKAAYIYGFLLALFLGMYIPKVPDRIFYQGYFWIILLMIVIWMVVYATLVDYRKKNAIDISMIILLLGLMIGLIWTRNPGSIIALPNQWLGQEGFIGRPRFQHFGTIIGYPIYSFPGMFKESLKLIKPLLIMLFVHWITFLGFVELLPEFIPFRRKEQENYFKKYVFLQEGVFGLLGNHTGTGMNSSLFGGLLSWLNGAKTGISSVLTGIGFLGLMILIPFLKTSFVVFPVSPILAVMGTQLIIKALQNHSEEKNTWLSVVVALIVGGFTLSFYNGMMAGLITFCLEKLVQGKNRDINVFYWVLLAIAIVLSFFGLSIPYLPVLNF